MTIYHNPRCAKSRNALSLLTEKGVSYEIVEYLKEPLSEKELAGLLKKLDLPAHALIRKGESIFKEQFKGKELSEQDWIKAMEKYPKLMERPIVVKGNKAVIGRPTENVLELIN